jgi:Na+/H+ antiporter NhaC
VFAQKAEIFYCRWIMHALVAILLLFAPAASVPPEVDRFELAPARDYRVADLPVTVTVTAVDAAGATVAGAHGPVRVTGLLRTENGVEVPVTEVTLAAGKATLTEVLPTGEEVTVEGGGAAGRWQPALRRVPGILSLLPPLLAIALAVMLRQALLALFFGILTGALIVHGYDPLAALMRVFDTHLPATLVDPGHAAILLFTMALGGMVGIISRSGGTRALVAAISRRARSRRAGMMTAWASGLVIFFDDYANCLLVGNTVRPFTDELRVSREKLSYIVDSTAAPVATIALVSTWVGYQIGQLENVFGDEKYGLAGRGYELFLDILPYSFYSFFALAFVFMVAALGRDFGPMLRAERRALHTGQLLAPGAHPLMDRELTDLAAAGGPQRANPLTAVIPVVTVVLLVVIGLYASGRSQVPAGEASLRQIIAAADSYAVLLWASFGGSLVAFVTVLVTGTVRAGEAIDAWVGGVKSMVMAVIILILAWGLGTMCKDFLQTGPWLISQVAPSAHLLPIISFTVSGLIALATGSSYSTMAIVIPIVGPMAWALTGEGTELPLETTWAIRHATLAAILSGAVFGDHCSPISDTTIMSSMSAASDHTDHVRTQAPYAVLCAGVAGAVGFLPAGFGVSPLLTVPLGLAALWACLRFFGKRVED